MSTYGVIGMGAIGLKHVSHLRELHPTSTIFAVSASGDNSNKVEGADDVIAFDTLIGIKPEYVIVASPAPFHVSSALRLIGANIPVLIEKPLSDSYQSCATLLENVSHDKLHTLGVAYCLRFLPGCKAVKQVLDQGHLGRIYTVNCEVGQYLPSWRPGKCYTDSVSSNKRLGGGVLLELSHELDYLQYFFGDLNLAFSWLRQSGELNLDVEDMANLILFDKSETLINVSMDFVRKTTVRRCEIIGEKGALLWDLVENTIQLQYPDEVVEVYSGPASDNQEMYLNMVRAFEAQLRQRKQFTTSIADASLTISVVEAAREASKAYTL